MKDEQLIRDLVPHWHATRAWAEELLRRALKLQAAEDVLRIQPKNVATVLAGSNWVFRTHGIGVNLDRGVSCGGIDFDFNKPEPDAWRLAEFAVKQLNAGNLPPEYRDLVDDRERFTAAAARVLGTVAG